MESGTKNALLIGAGVLAGYLLFFRNGGKAGRPAGGIGFAEIPYPIGTTIIADGITVYTARIYITNNSTKAGVTGIVSYNWYYGILLTNPSGGIISSSGIVSTRGLIPASSVKTAFDYTFTVPAVAANVGACSAFVQLYKDDGATAYAGTGNSATVAFTITAATVVPAGTIAW